MIRKILWSALACALASVTISAAPIDGPNAIFHDPLLDNMVGHWSLTGTMLGKPAQHSVDVEWVLNHQFLEIHETALPDPKIGQGAYEALPMIGYDNMSERYVMHWIDIFGGRFSETLGYGKRDGDEIVFVFEYPDGPFRSRLIWDAARKHWHWLMNQKDSDGKWTPFADLVLTPR